MYRAHRAVPRNLGPLGASPPLQSTRNRQGTSHLKFGTCVDWAVATSPPPSRRALRR